MSETTSLAAAISNVRRNRSGLQRVFARVNDQEYRGRLALQSSREYRSSSGPVSGACSASLPIETSRGRANAVAFARPAGVESGKLSPFSVVPTLDSVGLASRDERIERVWWRMGSGLYLPPWAAGRIQGFIERGFAVSGKRDDGAAGAAGEARSGPQIGSATAPYQCGKVAH